MLVAVGGEDPSAAAAATDIAPGGEKGPKDDRDWDPRRAMLGPWTAMVLFGLLPGTLMGDAMLCVEERTECVVEMDRGLMYVC